MKATTPEKKEWATPELNEWHLGIIYQVIDLGSQSYEGGEAKPQVAIGVEFPNCPRVEFKGKMEALCTRERCNLVLGDNAKLTMFIKACGLQVVDGVFTDFDKMLGKNINCYYSHKSFGDEVLPSTGITSAAPNDSDLTPEHVRIHLDLGDFNQPAFASLNEGTQKIIMDSPEYVKATSSIQPVDTPSQAAGNHASESPPVEAYDEPSISEIDRQMQKGVPF